MAKKPKNSLADFCKCARAAGTTYAKLQIRETCELIGGIRPVPAGYRRAGDKNTMEEEKK